MATTAATNSIPITYSNTLNHSNQPKEQMYGIPVKFADNLFSTLIKEQINEFINLQHVKGLKYTDENAIRTITYEIIEILKQIVCQHIKDNYKVIIQVITYPKKFEENVSIMSQCLWNHRTDDVLSIEVESDLLKFFIVVHGVVA
ncbi:unnamed protein product [Rotaria sp. Silwood2]|nr:unnamed protein product [Rotaria sp. Silwood2]CAF3301590.1 unnamed protein product [Rotaria sp. Silwood2]CAF4442526.1 unnamed protein product [Rotaria sp. Silwood2]CAF4488305.1 unnamed protein product [Rotaria sp. Silwood2]CAF4720507.1 unnamed protein product [Rotaria sp. Silwood2]